MPTYEFDLPDGKKVRAEGSTPEQAWENHNLSVPSDPGRGYPTPKTDPIGDLREVGIGIAQGLLDPVEGIAQLSEHITGKHLVPDSVRDWARNLRKRAQGTWAGRAGEITGNVAGLAIPGSLVTRGIGLAGRGLGLVGRAAGVPAGLAERSAIGTIAGAAQPVQGAPSDEAYWHTKTNQALAGLGIGSTLGPLSAGLGRIPSTAHLSPYHPLTSLLTLIPRGLGSLGRAAAPATPGIAAAAATVEEQRRRDEGEEESPPQ